MRFWHIRYWWAGLQIWFWSKFHPCRIAYKEYDHDLIYIDDTYGDPGVINGMCVCGHWECEICGYVPDEQNDPPIYDDFY